VTEILLSSFWLILGFVFLIKGADLLVDGSASIARLAGIRELVIGLTIVSFGTSAPELLVNVVASLNGSSELAVGNVLGSNIANIFLILGVAAVIYPLKVHTNTTYKEIPFQLLAALVIIFLAFDYWFNPGGFNGLQLGDGLVLLGFFLVFMYYVYSISKGEEAVKSEVAGMSLGRSVLYLLVGIGGLGYGSHLIVEHSTSIATIAGVSERMIGLSVVAIGTSLPELAASAMAAYKRNTDLAIGNVVGSNIFNIFWIFGLSAVINPIAVQETSLVDFLLNIAASMLLFGVLFVGKKHEIERSQGGLFLIIYISYIAFLVYQN
jgi:cation:H+ antiporter